MLTLIIRSYAGPDALGISLRAAFPGVVSGMIAEAIVIAPPGASDCAEMADAAGAELVVERNFVEGFQAACRRSRQEAVLLFDGGVALDQTGLEGFRLRAPLPEGRVLATKPMQMGIRGALQKIFGRVTRDQVLLIGRGHAMTLTDDPWSARFGRGLKIIPVRTERPGS
jgi:hypothetical protein